ncbi:MAG: prepilin-type N-terminal cleavage/methylation domain-containing protein [Candidatus Sungbacteria bacterium]|nr:prepilin-type N-terminal cleavage/methylation domain-containing protein [Candidatus Sungbacteria bacterium]
MNVKHLRTRGFTLIELLVVISIISLLASIVLASLNSARAKARDTARSANVKSLKTALEFYFDNNGGYPTSNGSSNGDVLLSDATLVSKLVPTYIPSMPGILVADGDHYYAGGLTSGVSGRYDMLIYNEGTNSPNPCRSGTMPDSTGDWGVAAVCRF